MKTTRTRLIALVLALLMVPLAAMAQSEPAEKNDAGMPYVLNEFTGTKLDVSQYKGKAIWINFFTGWCVYCMEEMPAIRQVFDDYNPDEVAIVLVHVWDGENADDSAAIVEKYGLQGMILLEDDALALSNLVGLQGYPTSIFIDKDGYLNGVENGLDYDSMAQYMDGMGVAKLQTATPAAQ